MAKKDELTDEINHVLKFMSETKVDSEEYGIAAQNLKVLYEARSKKAHLVAPEAILGAVTNLVGIVLILNYEYLHVVSSRAFQLIFRPKV